MKNKIIIFCFLLMTITKWTFGQNVGFGTTNPEYKADVAGRMRIRALPSGTPGIRLEGSTNLARAFVGPLNETHLGIFGYGSSRWDFVSNVNNGNIGMGTTAPAFRIDLKGRMRIQQDTSTAGIWFDGASLPTRSFIGTFNNDYVGLFGNGGAGWAFLMNVNNGNIGIGTSEPTRRLDINGNLRIRGNSPTKGSVLSSIDNQGNASWAKPHAFNVSGTINNVPFLIENLTWTKVLLNQSPTYNVGAGYLPAVSEYEVQESGIYHFKSVITFLEKANKHSIRIRMRRNGVTSTIGEIYHEGFFYHQQFSGNNTGAGNFDDPMSISVQAHLLPGDRVWLEAFINLHSSGGVNTNISEDGTRTWFQGKLIART
jgi:hypothetical protein